MAHQQMSLALHYYQTTSNTCMVWTGETNLLAITYNIGQGSKIWWKKVFSYTYVLYSLEKYTEPAIHDPAMKKEEVGFLGFRL